MASLRCIVVKSALIDVGVRRCLKLVSSSLLTLLFVFFTANTWAVSTDEAGPPPRLSISVVAMEFPGFAEQSPEYSEGTGIAVDMARAAFAAGGVDVQFEFVPIVRAMSHMLNGKRQVLLGNNSYMPEQVRAKHFKLALFPVNNVVFYHNKYFNPGELSLKEAISQHLVVWPYAPKNVYYDPSRLKIVPDAEDVLNVIVSGRAPLGVLPWLTVRSLMKVNHPSELENLSFFSPAIIREWSGIVIDTTYDNSEELIERLKIGYKAIESDGTQQEIYDRYWPNRSVLKELLATEPLSRLDPPDSLTQR